MKQFRLLAPVAAIVAAIIPTVTSAANLSPESWPVSEREALEKLESQTWSPLTVQKVEGSEGLISATVSPLAVYAGVQALKQGGSAADAAATVALTQITTQLGSVVSYAGVFTMLYHEASTGKTYSLDAGFNSYLKEDSPLTIPAADLASLRQGPKGEEGGAKGRTTLTPGFMAGIEAMQGRFGKLPFRDLFAPAIWYDEHGITISPTLAGFFQLRKDVLARTPEGRRFMAQGGGELPKPGSCFRQLELAETLKAVAREGAKAMYEGDWARAFVAAVQRDGGKVTEEDLKRYAPIWSEPYQQTVFGHRVCVNGKPQMGAFSLLAALNLAEARQLDRKGPYWSDRDSFLDLTRISRYTASAPAIHPRTAARLRDQGLDISLKAQLGKEYAQALAPQLEKLLATENDESPKHSNAIVVVDRNGNIAVITHTINAVVWGGAGIVVGGIPLPDSAGFQQKVLAAIKPGDRLPHQIVDTIVFKGDRPVIATASIGSSLLPETLRILVGLLGQGQELESLLKQPPLLASFVPVPAGGDPARIPVTVPDKGYAPAFLAGLKAELPNLTAIESSTASALRGTLAVVMIDPGTGKRRAINQPGIMVFNSAE